MINIDMLKEHHSDIDQMISDLRAMLDKEQLKIRPHAENTHRLICELAEKMTEHLSRQDQDVYPDLLIHEDPKLKSMAWGFLNGQKPIRKQFKNYQQKWLKDCDFEFSDEFLADTMEIFETIEDRLKRERSVLIPTIEAAGGAAAAAL